MRPTLISFIAEGEGFEPSIPCGIHAFQACALGHYATPPKHEKFLSKTFTSPPMILHKSAEVSRSSGSQIFLHGTCLKKREVCSALQNSIRLFKLFFDAYVRQGFEVVEVGPPEIGEVLAYPHLIGILGKT